VTIGPLAATWGAVIEGTGEPLVALDRGDVIARFKERGALLFRGFACSSDAFAAFADSLSRRTLRALHVGPNRERVPGDEHSVTVDLGQSWVGFHLEMGYSPARPDLLWLHCLRPAARDGQTLVADGVTMLAEMDPALEAIFRARRLRYRFRGAERSVWSLFAGEPLDREQALERLRRVPGVRVAAGAGDTLDLEYVTAAIQPTRHGGEAFACSLMIFDGDTVSFDDGAPIDRGLRLEIAALASRCSVEIGWRAGDVLLLDNSRVMHGRMPFDDRARRIHVRMSDAAF
jgi:hypothetical protein